MNQQETAYFFISLLHYSTTGGIMSASTAQGDILCAISPLHSFTFATITFLVTKSNSDLCCSGFGNLKS